MGARWGQRRGGWGADREAEAVEAGVGEGLVPGGEGPQADGARARRRLPRARPARPAGHAPMAPPGLVAVAVAESGAGGGGGRRLPGPSPQFAGEAEALSHTLTQKGCWPTLHK